MFAQNHVGLSGFSAENFFALGHRFEHDRGFQIDDSESWIERSLPNNQMACFRLNEWLTGVWVGAKEQLWISSARGAVRRFDYGPGGQGDQTRFLTDLNLQVPAVGLWGVWGLDDNHVYTWGSTHKGQFPLFRWNGNDWSRMADPGFEIRHLHGIAPDLLYAVGSAGALASWDGQSWTRHSVPTNENLYWVHVVSEDEAYATGRNGSLLQGSARGWWLRARGPSELSALWAVTKWNGDVWIAGGVFGLLRLIPNSTELEVVKPKIDATGFDARGDLLIMTANRIVTSSNGVNFSGQMLNVVLSVGKDRPLRYT